MASKASGASDRLQTTTQHLNPKPAVVGAEAIRVNAFPLHRQDILKWNGWGFRDSAFELDDRGIVTYDVSGTDMPLLRQWMEENRGIDMTDYSPAQLPFTDVAVAIKNEDFMKAIDGHHGGISFNPDDRIFHSHGHTCQELYALRHSRPGRIPDAVVWPDNNANVEAIVQAADRFNVVIIPFGGGTTVSGAVLCPEGETRMIVSLDTSKMNRVLWIDKENMLARFEAGVVGVELERKLAEYGVCTGHQPDSYEFSTLGGWVATRASGMKKNVYGNIEDLVVRVKFVTARGTVEKGVQAPRISAGPDVNEVILGSEGTLGVVTEATLKIRPLPEATAYGSIVFPGFAQGVACLKEISDRRLAPASIRLMDNEQFQFGHALKPPAASFLTTFVDKIKTFYVTKIKGFDPHQLCVATLLFEGTKAEIEEQQKKVYELAAKHGGMAAGEENGKRGYLLTFVIAYLRDIGFDYKYIAESFETSVPWSCVPNLCRNVKDRVVAVCREQGVKGEAFISSRVTQTYDCGACVYFYYGFLYTGLKDPMATFHHVEVAARDEVIANGGSVSHHHGIGKIRKRWLAETISPTGVEMLKAVKAHMDPKNIFAVGNLLP